MALKGRDVIAAGVAAFFAWGYAVSWIPALRWVGYAFVGGATIVVVGLAIIISTTSWDPALRPSRRDPRPAGLAFLDRRLWAADLELLRTRQEYPITPISVQSAGVCRAVDELLDLISQEFVRTWHRSISPHDAFPSEVDKVIREALLRITDRLRGLDLAEVLTGRIAPILTAHFRDFYDAEHTVRGRKLNRSVTESEELDLAIASKFREGSLHPAASLSFPDTKAAQQDHLRRICSRVLPHVVPRSLLSSRAVVIIVREIVSCAVLFPVVQTFSDPDTWNQLVESYGRSMLQDRSTVRRLRAALDEHASPRPRQDKLAATPRLAPGESDRKFENFIRAIRKTNNLSDARRFRSAVASQFKRDGSRDNSDPIYLRRLEMGKRLLDQKVQQLAVLGGGDKRQQQSQPATVVGLLAPRVAPHAPGVAALLQDASLVELLRNSSGLSCFMEYMDRLGLMPLLQFWLVVDSFRNPLEDEGQDDDHPPSSTLLTWTESDRMDLHQMEQAYLRRPELKVPEPIKQDVREFIVTGKAATPVQYYKARRAILSAQSIVLDEMQSKHFGNFRKSDLFFKCLASLEASAAGSGSAPSERPGPSPSPSTPQPPYARSPHSFHSKPPSTAAPPTRRAGSVTDLWSQGTIGAGAGTGPESNARRASLDGEEDVQPPIFYDVVDDGRITDYSLQSSDYDHTSPAPDSRVIQAVEQALNTIMEDSRPESAEDLRKSLFASDVGGPGLSAARQGGGAPPEEETYAPITPAPRQEADKPSLASLGLVSQASRIGVFIDDDLFGDEDRFLPDDHPEIEGGGYEDDADGVHEAAPGDLGLVEAITALTDDIDRLAAQDSIIDSLVRKAELTNNMAELRILRKSKASLQREMRRKELQRQQYVVQESDNSLYGRSSVSIRSVQVGKEDDGREFALYVVEVSRDAGEQMPAAVWVVTRRYSEFHELHQKLRARYPSVRNLDFPRRRVVVMKFQKEFIRKRRQALETYLRGLLLLPEVCRSRELRAFLSQSAIAAGRDFVERDDKKDVMTRLYDSVTDGMDDLLGNMSVLDQITTAGQNLIAAATNQFGASALPLDTDGVAAAEAEAELNAFENKDVEPFIKPICDIFLEVFELNRGKNWLRGRAVVMVLQQLLGGTIERKVRDNVRMLIQQDSILRFVGLIRSSIRSSDDGASDSGSQKTRPVRPDADKVRTRKEAGLMLATLIPDVAGSVVGRLNAQAAGRRIFATVNNHRLNAHLVFTLVDEIVAILFGER